MKKSKPKKYVNKEITYSAPPIPEKARDYLKMIAKEAPTGRDGLFCSPYLERKRNEFGWKGFELKKPSLVNFSRWVMSSCKGGLDCQGKRKKVAKKQIVPEEIRKQIIETAKALTGGKLADSFLGSPGIQQGSREV